MTNQILYPQGMDFLGPMFICTHRRICHTSLSSEQLHEYSWFGFFELHYRYAVLLVLLLQFSIRNLPCKVFYIIIKQNCQCKSSWKAFQDRATMKHRCKSDWIFGSLRINQQMHQQISPGHTPPVNRKTSHSLEYLKKAILPLHISSFGMVSFFPIQNFSLANWPHFYFQILIKILVLCLLKSLLPWQI